MDLGSLILGTVFVLYFIAMVFIQYKCICKMEEDIRNRKKKISQNEMYDKMSFQEQELQCGMQGKIITGTVAYIIYKIVYRKIR